MKYLQEITEFYRKISNFGHQLEVGEINLSFPNLQSLETITIPYLDIEINIYQAFKLLQKIFTFTNEMDDFVTIIYDYDKRLIRESLLVNLAAGRSLIHDIIVDPLPEDFNLEGDKSSIFHAISKFIHDKYSIEIGRIKIVHSQYLDKLNEKKLVFSNQPVELFRGIIQSYQPDKLQAYPEMPLFHVLERLSSILSKYLSNYEDRIITFPKNKIPITFFDEDWYITFIRTKQGYKVSLPYEFGRISIKDHFVWRRIVRDFKNAYADKYGTKLAYFIDIEWFMDFLSDLVESKFPLTKARWEYLLQKFLFFVKKIEELWDVIPRPIIYNGYVRFFTRLLTGFHINPRKLSYWSIPTNLSYFLRENFGPSDQIALLFTNNHTVTHGVTVKLNQSVLHEICRMKGEIIQNLPNSEKERYIHLISHLGFIKTIIFIELPVLQKSVKYLFVDRNSTNPFRFLFSLFLLKKLHNPKNFGCYPSLPWMSFFKDTRTMKLFRMINRVLYDFLEFL